jgi:phosphotriesterase-related protein
MREHPTAGAGLKSPLKESVLIEGMNRRNFLKTAPALTAALALPGCALETRGVPEAGQVMTVRGPIAARAMGVTLTHEHALANFQPFEEWLRAPARYDRDEVLRVVLPHLLRIREIGCRTFIDATAVGLGRDPKLLRALSERSGLNILTVTGNYGAFDNRFLPPDIYTRTPEDLARIWIDEFEAGIGDTGIRPGFIKLGFNGGPLSKVEQTLIRAAAIAHRETGLTIGAHTGPAAAAFEQLAVLQSAGVSASAWVWIHSQNEPDRERHIEAARRGAWISFDGIAPDTVSAHVDMVVNLRQRGLLGRALVSQDAGWYWVGKPGGGEFRPYDTIFTAFIPALRDRGFTADDIETLMVTNPARAFTVRRRDR